MHLAIVVSNGLGASPYAWLDPQVGPADCADLHDLVRYD
jgi:hypothetical protein